MAEKEVKETKKETAPAKKVPEKKPASGKPAAKKKAAAPKDAPAEKKQPAVKKAETAEKEDAAGKKAAPAAKKASGKLKITLVKSLAGRHAKHIATAKSLSLKRIGDITLQPDNPQTRGKIAQISYMVTVTET